MASLINDKIWELSKTVHVPANFSQLQALTKQLITIYTEQGRIDENPFSATLKRKIGIPEAKLKSKLIGKTCLITGGLGCVGSVLINKLLAFNVKSIIVIDKVTANKETENKDPRIIYIEADICDSEKLKTIFQANNPDYVFHIAAQRDPGYAEKNILETIQTNILGTHNVILACEKTKSVKDCVFSSTGKASRYYTTEIYAATKKFCEYMFDSYAKHSRVRYAMVRFTHVLDNSLMHEELRNLENKKYLEVHSQGKYVTAQNAGEAGDLLLNALISSQKGICNFSIVKQLEWPVESLEVALFYLKQAQSDLPIIFKGNPPGYCEKFFRGQMDWSNPQDLNLLINVYETRKSSVNAAEDIITSQIPATNFLILQNALFILKSANNEYSAKACLLAELKNVVQAALNKVDQHDTINILEWGLDPNVMKAENTTITDFWPTVSLLYKSLEYSEHQTQLNNLIRNDYFKIIDSSYSATYDGVY
ncbi:polysaccharide biosynthesis protein [Pedobacter mucosus]|uniref:polysaccharide biosynthesis protein n=1 Tax=Pedobacter mucosus TaxID=2895286 RepID=UPI001EE3AD54|nr:polysaccharide biosynthesis protein [Pedobacter mucosus]UKT62251.1 polysaccharide biosynthesis protein [Pedobacter mucosus]